MPQIEEEVLDLYEAHEEMGHFEPGTMMAEAYLYLCRALIYAKHDQYLRASQYSSIASAIIMLDRCDGGYQHIPDME